MSHIELARWADLILIAPCTANTLAQLASGQASDLLTTLWTASECEKAIAPAMNQQMWKHPQTQENLSTFDRSWHKSSDQTLEYKHVVISDQAA